MYRLPTVCLVLYSFVCSLPVFAEAVDSGPGQVVTLRSFADIRLFNAVVEAEHQSTVSAQTSGRIIEINFDVDDYVKKDSILLRLADKEQKSRLNSAQSSMKEAQANAEQARKEFQRIESIYARKLVSKAVFDKAVSSVKSAEARLKAARARVDEAREQWEHTIVRAPFSGIVVKRFVQVGEATSPGQELMTGLSLDHLRVVVDFPQGLSRRLRNDAGMIVILPGGMRIPVESSDVTIFPYADIKTHSLRARLKVPMGLTDLYPGMTVKVGIEVGRSDRIMVPLSALVLRGEVEAVYVKDSSGKVLFRQVRAGDRQGNLVSILAGLRVGDVLLLDPLKAVNALKSQRTK